LDATALSEEYSRADVFVLATWGETYGMAVADAIAHHLPVVSTSVGEIGSIVGEGGILVEPGSVDELRAAIRAVMNDAELRQTLSDGSCRAAAKLPTWDQSVESVAAVLTKVAQA
jgi:glycosyltransferase involved in cell wall biosynthesis